MGYATKSYAGFVAISLLCLCFDTSARAQTQQCTKDEVLKLISAGYSKEEIQKLCSSSSLDTAIITLKSELVDGLLHVFLPLTITIGSLPTDPKISVLDEAYCGSKSSDSASLIAVASVANIPDWLSKPHQNQASIVIPTNDCSQPLDSIWSAIDKTRFTTALDIPYESGFLVRLGTRWQDGNISFLVEDVYLPTSLSTNIDRNTLSSSLKNSGSPVKTISLPIVPIQVGAGILRLAPRLYFGSSNVTIGVQLLSDADHTISAFPDLDNSGNGSTNSGNLVVRAPLAFVNAFLKSYLEKEPFILHTGVASIGDLKIGTLQTSFAGGLNLEATILDSQNRQLHAQLGTTGTPPAIQTLKIQSVPKDCTVSPIAEAFRCAAENALLTQAANLVSQVLSPVLQGRPLYKINETASYTAQVSQKNVIISGTITGEEVNSQQITVSGNFQIHER